MSLQLKTRDPVVHDYVREARQRDRRVFVLVMGIGLFIALIARDAFSRPLAIGLALTAATIAAWIVRPRVGLYATVFFTFIGDQVTSPWYPFTKGFSSIESMMFIDKKLIISPLELCLIAGILSLFVQYLVNGRWPFALGPSGPAVCAFTFFVAIGLVYGIASGGDRHIALFQARPFFALAAMYFLTATVCTTRAHYRHVLWLMLVAIEINSIISLFYVLAQPAAALELPEGLVDHAGVMRMDILLFAAIASWLLRGNSMTQRLTLTLMSVPVLIVYVITQRRAAMVALFIALMLLSAILFWRQRKTFYRVIPIIVVLVAGYVGAFWNSQSSAGFPAQAVKSAIFPSETNERNKGSDEYRTIESIDLNYTVHASKVLGLGLGRPFYRPIALPSLDAFALNAYVPHNSILWVWIAFGFGGFVSMFCLFGRTLMVGAERIRAVATGQDLTVLTTLVVTIVIFIVFAAVDIAWSHEDMALLGICIAAAANYPVPKLRPGRSRHQPTPGCSTDSASSRRCSDRR